MVSGKKKAYFIPYNSFNIYWFVIRSAKVSDRKGKDGETEVFPSNIYPSILCW